MGIGIYSFVTGTILPLAILAFVGWAVWEAARRPSAQFALASLKKGPWLAILIASVIVVGNGYVWSLYIPFRGILSLAALFAALYFLGPECRKMGPPSRGGRKEQKGSW